MFTRRMLFKMLAAIGAGSLVPVVGEGGVVRFSGIGEALSFGGSVRPEGSPAPLVNRRSMCRRSSNGKTCWMISTAPN